MNAPFQGLKHGSIGVHLSDNQTEYFELIYHITVNIYILDLWCKHPWHWIKIKYSPSNSCEYQLIFTKTRGNYSQLHSQFWRIGQRGAAFGVKEKKLGSSSNLYFLYNHVTPLTEKLVTHMIVMFSSMMPSQIERCVHTNYISNDKLCIVVRHVW
jgi:hypothetical protein